MMYAKDIIEHIDEIYARFQVPAHLQHHMRLVAGVTLWLVDHCKEPVDRDLLLACAFVHDLGNIVKFDFSQPLEKGMEHPEEIEELKKVQVEMEERYGKKDHHATMMMLNELGVDKKILNVLELSDWRSIKESTRLRLLVPMMLSYADYRVAPYGVVSVQERIADIHKRYRKKHNIKFDEAIFQESADNYEDLEIVLFEFITGKPEDINNESVQAFS